MRVSAKAGCLAVLAAVAIMFPTTVTSAPSPTGSAAVGGPTTPAGHRTAEPGDTAGQAGLGRPTPTATPAATAGAAPQAVPAPGGGIDFPTNPTYQRSSVSQHGITWHFDQSHQVGQYANGDWWVVGPVTLTSISPASTGERNGENVNPRKGDEGYDANLGRVQRLSYPVEVSPGSSVVKGVSRTSPPDDSHRGQLQTAAVLTVVEQPPPKNGAIAFRPPYFEREKPQYLTTDLRTNLLPRLPAPDGVDLPSLDWAASTFSRLQLDHNPHNEENRRLHPVENMADYGAKVAVDSNQVALRLMLDDPLSSKARALINYVQYGIDLSAMVKHRSHICADSRQSCAGHGSGRTLALVFAATLLDSADMQTIIASAADTLPENYSVTRTSNAPTPLFGDAVCDQELYDQVRHGGSGPRTCRDPHGYIDGGDQPGRYQVCCMSQPWKGAVTAMHLLPELAAQWPQSDKLIEYVDRFVTFGLWMQPDPHGRFASAHGSQADEGHYRSPLADALWAEHDLSSRIAVDWSRR